MEDEEKNLSMSLDEFASKGKRNRSDTNRRNSNSNGQSKRFRPTDSNPGSRTSTSRRPMAMGAAGAQRHRGGSRGTNKRQIRWNGRQLDVQLHKTIVVKVLPNGVVILNSGGWRSMQTLTTINSVIKFIQLRVHFVGNDVWDGNWFVTNDRGWNARFGDNMCITGGGLDVSGRVDVLMRHCPPVPVTHRRPDAPVHVPAQRKHVPKVTPNPPKAREVLAPQPNLSKKKYTQKDLAALCTRCGWERPKYISTMREVAGKTQVMCSEVRLSLAGVFKLSLTTAEPARWCSEVFGARDEAAKRAYAMLMERIVGPTVSKATSGGQALSSSSSKPVTHEKKSSAAAAATQGPDERVVDSKDEPEDEDDEEEDDDKEDHWRR